MRELEPESRFRIDLPMKCVTYIGNGVVEHREIVESVVQDMVATEYAAKHGFRFYLMQIRGGWWLCEPQPGNTPTIDREFPTAEAAMMAARLLS